MSTYKNKNENFFKKWSSEMAYVLGFFAADGCMIKNNRGAHFIEFQITDKDLLVKIKKLPNSNNKISVRERDKKWKTAYRLQVGSRRMFYDLLSLGMTPRKSKSMKMPEVPKKYFNHFVRGYFDGDGNVYANKYQRKNREKMSVTLLAGFTCGSKIFLKELHKKLRHLAKISGGTLYDVNGYSRLYYSVNDSCRLYNFMYNAEGRLFLKRKKEVFEKYFKMDR
jgi:intein-encoded DNA endonuclease-like protein